MGVQGRRERDGERDRERGEGGGQDIDLFNRLTSSASGQAGITSQFGDTRL